MGFYLELKKSPRGHEYRETGTPSVFWMLYFFTGFALVCMGGAAHAVLGDLAAKGSPWDKLLVWLIIAAIPFYLLVGVKLLGVRKFVRFEGESLRAGFRFFSRVLFERLLRRNEIRSIELINQKPSANLAPRVHGDRQYYIRGHWRLVAWAKSGKAFTLDKHTEQGALSPLYKDLQTWLSG